MFGALLNYAARKTTEAVGNSPLGIVAGNVLGTYDNLKKGNYSSLLQNDKTYNCNNSSVVAADNYDLDLNAIYNDLRSQAERNGYSVTETSSDSMIDFYKRFGKSVGNEKFDGLSYQKDIYIRNDATMLDKIIALQHEYKHLNLGLGDEQDAYVHKAALEDLRQYDSRLGELALKREKNRGDEFTNQVFREHPELSAADNYAYAMAA